MTKCCQKPKQTNEDGCCKGCCSLDIQNHEENNIKIVAFRLIFAGVFFALAIFLKDNLILSALSLIIAGYDIVWRAVKNILKGQVFDENFLMTIATVGAFFIGENTEGAAVMLFYQVGELFQEMSVDRSRRAIASLMDIRPDFATLPGGMQVPPETVRIGDLIIIKPGEKVPLDGVVTEGSASVDTSPLTGESMPKDVQKGDEVLSGSLCINGLLTVRVTREYTQSTVSKILELTQNASSQKSPTEKFITKFARVYTPIVTAFAVIIATLPPLVLGQRFSPWIYKALVFLVVSCPCALVISIPLGFFGGISRASRRGILVKGGNYLEALRNIDTVVFDKTGTLTKGVFKVSRVEGADNLLEIAAHAEYYSNHPIAKSIVSAFDGDIDQERISNYIEIAGFGIKAVIDGVEVFAGNEKLVANAPKLDDTAVFISIGGEYAGYITVEDEIKSDAIGIAKALKKYGVKKTVMLTGDNQYIGKKVAKEAGVDEGYYSLLPQDKVEKMEQIGKDSSTLFVGDGINDAPSLAMADVGVAMGGVGSDAAIEAADVVIMTDEPSKITDAISVARFTNKVVWQNIIFSISVKVLVMILAATGFASMWYAVFADVGVAFLAVLNAMRLIYNKSF